MAINNDAEKRGLANSYGDKLLQKDEKLKSLLGDNYDFVRYAGYYAQTKLYKELVAAMKNPDFCPSEYITEHLFPVIGAAIPERNKEVILYFADKIRDYPYADSLYRRSFRSGEYRAYTNKIANLIGENGSTRPLFDQPLDKILDGDITDEELAYMSVYPWGCQGYTEWQVAYALDKGDEKAEAAIRRVLTDENSSKMTTTELIRGVLLSHRSDFHELIGKLLLAAKLQEGLRQAICENADCGTREGFLAVLKVIDKNDLIRFSSVKRAVGTWIGLITEESPDLERISDKSVRLIADCLTDKTLREEYLLSEDSMKIYIALWSYGFDDINVALNKVTEIADGDSVHRLLTAGYFAAGIDLPYAANRTAKTVLNKYCDNDKVLSVMLDCFIPTRLNIIYSNNADVPAGYNTLFNDKEDLNKYYDLIKKIYSEFKGETKKFSHCVFPWHETEIKKRDLAELLCTLAELSGEDEKIDEVCPLIKECESRWSYFSVLLKNPNTPLQRMTAIEGLADRLSDVRYAANEIVSKLDLTEEEYRKIEEYLRFKDSYLRKTVIGVLMRQSDEALKTCIARLLSSPKEEIRLGALDMLVELRKDEKRKQITASFSDILAQRAESTDLPAKERLLLGSLLPEKSKSQSEKARLFSEEDKYLPTTFDFGYAALCAKTFARYFPDSALPSLIGSPESGSDTIKSDNVQEKQWCQSATDAAKDIASLSDFIGKHKTLSFTNYFGEQTLLGNARYYFDLHDKSDNLLLGELWKEWAETNQITNERIVRARVLCNAYTRRSAFKNCSDDIIATVFGAGFEQGKPCEFYEVVKTVIWYLCKSVPKEEKLRLAYATAFWFVRCVPDDKILIPCSGNNYMRREVRVAHLITHEQLEKILGWLCPDTKEDFSKVFPLSVAMEERCFSALRKYIDKIAGSNEDSSYLRRFKTNTLISPDEYTFMRGLTNRRVAEYLFAAYKGVITMPQLYEFLFNPDNITFTMPVVSAVATYDDEDGKTEQQNTRRSSDSFEKVGYELLQGKKFDRSSSDFIVFVYGVYSTIVPIIMDSELSRGDSSADYTKAVFGISHIKGAEYFARILEAMGNDVIVRSFCYGQNDDYTRASSLSRLLSVCIPDKNDSAETLKNALSGKKITKKRLIEAATYSPDWIPIVGKYLQINSFESVCYYFIAHMNEQFDDKRKAIIAKFTPLSEDELNFGAFDLDWFRSAYDAIGKEEFDMIYDAAKYITDGAKHARARKYADAATGKLDEKETEKLIDEKRNKDLLDAYALIPLSGEDDVLHRYLFVQKFRKESKKFGAQRIASENKAADMALKNLATNAGYSDSMRLTLKMETKIIDENRDLFEPKTIDGVSLCIEIDQSGKASLSVRKNGKELKSVPAKLKKDQSVIELTDMVKTLTEQFRRTRIMFEQAMEDQTEFTFGEISALTAHPVVYPMLKTLVFCGADAIGFISDQGLVDADGNERKLSLGDKIKIAHPFDLYKANCWRAYQKYLFDNRITQPFRQVFRELYVKTPEESNLLYSERYAGNQLQPAKTVAVLKNRRWVADVENGLQKVYYKENIVAQLYALADWFTPADIESPTLERVCFSDRKTGEPIKIADIPDVIFSEVMRDVDLAVSVAHAGGVDPETSHSTTEMRAAILSFVLPMFGITNVELQDRHAIIDGKLAQYSVHLGSGVVHQIGGTMIPVLPVHSQQKGKIFLPFVDDDPKTAEIVSKVLLFAEDDKIKDPAILSCIEKQ